MTIEHSDDFYRDWAEEIELQSGKEGVSVSRERYSDDALKLFKLMGRIASRESFIENVEHPDIVERYGNKVQSMIEGAHHKQQLAMHEMRQIFRTDELIAAGFAPEDVNTEFWVMYEELRTNFFGPGNENKRARVRRKLKKQAQEAA